MFVPGVCLQCLVLVAFSSMVRCQTKINQPPWIRPEAMPEILYEQGAPPQIIRVLCPTASGDYANVTWWRGEKLIAAGQELLFRPLESHHIGEYHCKAKNEAGVSVSRVLKVRPVFIKRGSSTVQRLFVMEGQAASIPCEVPEGYPHPEVFWNTSKPDPEMPMIVDQEGTLHLPFISSIDHGSILKCSAVQLGKAYAIKAVELVVYPRPSECVESPHFLYVSENVNLKKHSETLIYCVPSGPPTPIDWTLPGSAKAAVNYDANYVLRINASTLAINERGFAVTCDREGLENVVSVNLASEPIILPMTNVSTVEGKRVFLKCHAHGKPKPRIEWFFNGDPVDKLNIVDDVIVLPNVTFKDMGVYRCDAVNLHGRAYQEVALSVNRAKPHILVDTDCFETVVGQRLSIPCETFAFREPIRTWLKNGRVINGTQNDESLEFINVRVNDTGLYECRVCEGNSSCSSYNFEIKVLPSRLVETPNKPIVVFEDEPLNISCIPYFADDIILWRIDGKLVQRGRTLQVERPLAGTYSCELHRNDWKGPVTHWDATVSVRKIDAKFRITKISCTGEGFAYLEWMPLDDVAFYEILHLTDPQNWETVKIVKDRNAARIELGPCSPCRFRVKSHYETRSLISDIQECLPPSNPERGGTALSVENVTVSRENEVFHVNWTSLERRKLCRRVCALPSMTCLDTYGTRASFGLKTVSPKSTFTVAKCNSSKAEVLDAASMLEIHYNCDLKLHITEIRQTKLNSVRIFWDFASDPCCALTGQLEVVGHNRSENVDLRKKQFLLKGIENNRFYCLELKAHHGNQLLQASQAYQSCFVSGQGWQVLESPLFQIQYGARWISLPNDTALYYSVNGKFEPWSHNTTTVSLRELGETSIKFVRRLDGECEVSNLIFLENESSADWYLWLCGSFIVAGGVAITAAVLLRKRSTFYETGYI